MTRGYKQMVDISDHLIAKKNLQLKEMRLNRWRKKDHELLPSMTEFGAQTMPTSEFGGGLAVPRYAGDLHGFQQIKHKNTIKVEESRVK